MGKEAGNSMDFSIENSVETQPAKEKPAMTETGTSIILYKRRWIILLIFSLISMSNEVIWISLSSIASIVTGYYNITFNSVHWLALIFPLSNVATIIIAIYVLKKFGLRAIIIGGALSNTAGGAFRFIAYRRNRFIYAYIGNAFGGLGQSFVSFVPPALAATWFGESERGKASAIGLLANQLGIAVGYLMGTMFVPHSDDYDGEVKKGIFTTLLCQFVFFFILLLFSIILIKNAPPTPPSRSQVLNEIKREKKKSIQSQSSSIISEVEESLSTGLLKNWKAVLSNLSFHFLCQAYGLYFGVYVAFSNLLNEISTHYFPGKEKLVGIMGFSSVLFGLVGIMLCGIWIDRTHRYKSMCLVVYIGCVASVILFNVVIKYSHNFAATFVSYCIYGVFAYPYLSIGLEYTVEIMYPIKESSLSITLMVIGPLYGFLLTNVIGAIVQKAGPEVAGYVAAGIYMAALIFVMLVKGDLKRYSVDTSGEGNHPQRSVSQVTMIPD